MSFHRGSRLTRLAWYIDPASPYPARYSVRIRPFRVTYYRCCFLSVALRHFAVLPHEFQIKFPSMIWVGYEILACGGCFRQFTFNRFRSRFASKVVGCLVSREDLLFRSFTCCQPRVMGGRSCTYMEIKLSRPDPCGIVRMRPAVPLPLGKI